jgi:MYXO-CTERM domain-containing protein
MRNLAKVLAGFQLVALLVTSTAHATDYSAPGPLTVTTGNLGSTEGGSIGGYVVVPSGSGPYPLIIASHGWSATADQQVGWGQQFASYGFVVVAPSFPNTLSPSDTTDAQIIETLAALYADPTHPSPAQGKVDPTRLGLEGHSAGGLATTLASAAIHPQATVLFDPVDSNGDGEKALLGICSPVLGVFAQPSSCNNQEAWWPYANTTLGPEVLFHVVSSTHCDGENQSRTLCGSVCGGDADTTRQAEYARYATAFFLAELAGDANAAATLDIGALSANTAITSAIVKPGTPCDVAAVDAGAPAADAGPPPVDASTPDATVNEAGPAPRDAGSTSSPAPTTSPTSNGDTSPTASPAPSSGCSCRTSGGAPDGSLALALAAGLAWARRLRRRAR